MNKERFQYMSANKELSIILPCYNERENIVPLITALCEIMIELGNRLEIIVVDDSSPDGTADAVNEAFGNDQRIQCIVRTENRGFAFSIREGIECSTGNVVLVMDTDFNHRPDDAFILYRITQVVDFAIGSRFAFGGGMPDPLRYYLSLIYNIFMRVVLNTRLNDNLSGFFAIRREALQKLDFDKIFWGYGDYFFRMLLLSQRAQLRHVELPVRYDPRMGGIQKTHFISIFTQYTKEVLKIIYWKLTGRW